MVALCRLTVLSVALAGCTYVVAPLEEVQVYRADAGAAPDGSTSPDASPDNDGAQGSSGCPEVSLTPVAGSVDLGSVPSDMVLADVDGDGKVDALVALELGDSVAVALGNGDGTFQTPMSYSAGIGPRRLAVGDLDADSDLDLVVSSDAVQVLINTGGSFAAAVAYQPLIGLTGIAIADMDGDAVLDVVSVDSANEVVSVLLGQGNGTLGARTDFAIGGDAATLVVRDFDRSGTQDVVTLGDSGRVSMLLGNGDGTLQGATAFTVSSGAGEVWAADLDGDDALDVLSTNVAAANGLDLLYGNGDGSLKPAVSVQTSSQVNTGAVRVADFDFDDVADIVVAAPGEEGVVTITANASGTYSRGSAYATGAGSSPRLLDVADLDGNMSPDVAFATADAKLGALVNACAR